MEESIAIAAFNREQRVHFMTTLTIINAIINVGNGIIAAVGGGGSNSGNSDKFAKILEEFRELVLPDDLKEKESREQKMLDKLKTEVAKGPVRVIPKATTSSNKKGRILKRRRSVDGSKQSE
jgi:hypothetical protein